MTDRIALVRAGFDAFNRGAFEEAAEYLDEHIYWVARLASVDAPMLEGRAAVLRAWQEQSAALGGDGNFRFDVLTVEDVGGGCVVTDLRMHGVGARSEIEVIDEYTAIWTFRSGKVVRVDQYDTRDDALADLL